MPLVRLYVGNGAKDGDFIDADGQEELAKDLFIACREIVPAGMTSKRGPLAPGSIQFFPHVTVRDGMTVDVFVEIEAYELEDRKDIDDRAGKIKNALVEVFPDLTFAVWAKLVTAGYASDSTDDKFDGDMSMHAAVQRAIIDIRGWFDFVNPEDDTLENREIVRLVHEREQSGDGGKTLEEVAVELDVKLPPLIQIKRSD